MKSLELHKQYQKIINLIEKTKSINDIELQGHWGRYLCVLVAGFLENAISEVYLEFVTQSSSPQVAQYTISTLSKIQNPKTDKFIETASRFKKEWGEQLNTFFKEDVSRKTSIDSIMQTRHEIAHGKNTGITVIRVKEYFEKSIEVIEFIESQCNNKSE